MLIMALIELYTQLINNLSDEDQQQSDDSTQYLNKAILAGEYYSSNWKSSLEECLDIIQQNQNQPQIISEEEESIDIEVTNNNTTNHLTLSLDTILGQEASINPQNTDNSSSNNKNNEHHRKAIVSCQKVLGKILDNFEKIHEQSTNPSTFYLHHNIDVEISRLRNLIENDISPKTKELIILQINLALVEIDEFLDCKDSTLSILNEYKLFIEENNITNMQTWLAEVAQILIDKINYLIVKIDLRRLCNIKKGTDIQLIERKLTNSNKYYEFYNLTRNHYYPTNHSFDRKSLQQEINRVIKVKDEDIVLQEIHLINKRIRKFSNSSNDINEIKKVSDQCEKLINDVQQRLNNNQNLQNATDRFAYCSCINMLLNTKYLLKLTNYRVDNYNNLLNLEQYKIKGNTNFFDLTTFIAEEFECIERFQQNEFHIEDYYPFESLLNFINNFIEKKIREDITLLGIEKESLSENNKSQVYSEVAHSLDKIKSEILKVYTTFQERLNWCKGHKYNPIYLPIKECISKGRDGDTAVFLDSSYILPCDYNHISQLWYMTESDIRSNIRSLKNRVQIEIDKILLQKNAKEIKEEAKKGEVRAIQAISLFLTVAVFSLGSVKMVFENRNMYGSFAAVLGFGGCLLLFNAMFHWMVNSSEISNSTSSKSFGKYIVLGSCTALILSVILVDCSNKQIERKDSEIVRKTQDSLIKVFKDSIQTIHQTKLSKRRTKGE